MAVVSAIVAAFFGFSGIAGFLIAKKMGYFEED